MKYNNYNNAITILRRLVSQIRNERDSISARLVYLDEEIIRLSQIILDIENQMRDEKGENLIPRNPWDKYKLDTTISLSKERDKYKDAIYDIYSIMIESGSRPELKDRINKQHRLEWPDLWSKLDKLKDILKEEDNKDDKDS